MSLLPRHFFCSLTLLTAGLLSVSTAEAQQMYYPFSDRVPPGYTADMMARVRQDDPYYLQPIRIELPSEGTVAIYSANPEPSAVLAAPALASVNAGHLYRLRVADMPELPGSELYPSIEILDRLHPPVGRTLNYPIPIVLTKDDLEAAEWSAGHASCVPRRTSVSANQKQVSVPSSTGGLFFRLVKP